MAAALEAEPHPRTGRLNSSLLNDANSPAAALCRCVQAAFQIKTDVNSDQEGAALWSDCVYI